MKFQTYEKWRINQEHKIETQNSRWMKDMTSSCIPVKEELGLMNGTNTFPLPMVTRWLVSELRNSKLNYKNMNFYKGGGGGGTDKWMSLKWKNSNCWTWWKKWTVGENPIHKDTPTHTYFSVRGCLPQSIRNQVIELLKDLPSDQKVLEIWCWLQISQNKAGEERTTRTRLHTWARGNVLNTKHQIRKNMVMGGKRWVQSHSRYNRGTVLLEPKQVKDRNLKLGVPFFFPSIKLWMKNLLRKTSKIQKLNDWFVVIPLCNDF